MYPGMMGIGCSPLKVSAWKFLMASRDLDFPLTEQELLRGDSRQRYSTYEGTYRTAVT